MCTHMYILLQNKNAVHKRSISPKEAKYVNYESISREKLTKNNPHKCKQLFKTVWDSHGQLCIKYKHIKVICTQATQLKRHFLSLLEEVFATNATESGTNCKVHYMFFTT